jgi:hypothetical protein
MHDWCVNYYQQFFYMCSCCSALLASCTFCHVLLWSLDYAIKVRLINMLKALHSSVLYITHRWCRGSSIPGVNATQTKQCPLWQADSRSAHKDIPLMLRHPKVYYSFHNTPALIPVISQLNPNIRKFAVERRKTPSKTLERGSGS